MCDLFLSSLTLDALLQMGSWSGGDEALGSLGLPAFSSGATMMSMPQAAPSAYPGLQGLWGPVTQPPLTGVPSFPELPLPGGAAQLSWAVHVQCLILCVQYVSLQWKGRVG